MQKLLLGSLATSVALTAALAVSPGAAEAAHHEMVDGPKVSWKLSLCLIHLILDILKSLINIGTGNKFYINWREPFRTDRLDLFNTVKPLQLLLYLNGYDLRRAP